MALVARVVAHATGKITAEDSLAIVIMATTEETRAVVCAALAAMGRPDDGLGVNHHKEGLNEHGVKKPCTCADAVIIEYIVVVKIRKGMARQLWRRGLDGLE